MHARALTAAAAMAATLAAAILAVPPAALADRAQTANDQQSDLFRRILTRPGAELVDAPGGTATQTLPPFNAFYVYDQNDEWTKVGERIEGEPAGWIATDKVLNWDSTIVATFNNRGAAGREPALMFESREKLVELIQAENVGAAAAHFRARAQAGEPPEGSGVIAVEPEEYVDIRDRLYILPIMEAHRVRLPGRNQGKILRIASLSLEQDGGAMSAEDRKDKLKDFPVEIAFVIDTTRSMQPYIAETRRAIADFASRIAGESVGDRVRFALVEFRDSVALRPELGYVTRTALDFSPEADVDTFLDAIGGVREATVSSEGFNEDSLAGVHTAITGLGWAEAGAKMIFVVTDAGPRAENTSVEDMMEAEMRNLALEKGIAIWTWHLKTAGSEFDHDSAAAAYRELSQFNGVNTYMGIDLANPAAFGQALDDQVQKFEAQVRAAMEGEIADQAAGADPDDPATQVGLAMQLAYLGQVSGRTAPDFFEAWILQQDVPDFRKSALDIRILLTRNQLSTLHSVVKVMVEKMEDSILDPATFFDQLQTALALMAQDSGRIGQASHEFETLGDALGDFLKGLPYQTDIMDLTRSDWLARGGGGQSEIMLRLKSKLRAYREIHDDPELWTAPSPDAPGGEYVSAILLDLMP